MEKLEILIVNAAHAVVMFYLGYYYFRLRKWLEKKNLDKHLPIFIEIDRSTLPEDGQKVEWQTYDEDGTDLWQQGIFVDEDDLFCVGFSDTHKKFTQAWDVHHWRQLDT